jgi:hypothetical protein
MNPIKEKIDRLLGNGKLPASADIVMLLMETEAEIESEKREALMQKEQSLEAQLPALREKLKKAEEAEELAVWNADCAQYKPAFDAAVEEFAHEVQTHIQGLVSIFEKAAHMDERSHEINARAPVGTHTRFRRIECAARNLADFSNAAPSLAKECRLVDYENSDRQIWPPKGPCITSVLPPPESYGFRDPHSGTGDWWRKGAAAEAERQARERDQAATDAVERDRFWGRRA